MTVAPDTALSPPLAEILADLRIAATRAADERRLRRRRRRLLVLAICTAAALAGTAAARGLLGEPAPPQVGAQIAAVDDGMPASLRLNPDVTHARRAAVDHAVRLYVATLAGGGHCLVIVGAGADGGVPCTTAAQLGVRPIDVSLPFDDGAGPTANVVIGGRVNRHAATLRLVYSDGASDSIPLAPGGYFVHQVPLERRALAHGHALQLIASDATGVEIARADVPADWDAPAAVGDGPIRELLTRSDGRDFTRVLGIEGSVDPARVTRLVLFWPDGSRTSLPLEHNGSFELAVPARRQGDLAHRPAELVAYGTGGAIVARQAVLSVAAARERGAG